MFDLKTSDTDFVIVTENGIVADAKPFAPKMGASNCSKCNCKVYDDAHTGNDYCKCSHSYSDHF